LRCTAFFLLLVFSQKAGVGLFLHHLFHSTVADKKAGPQQHDEGKNKRYACTCVDDQLMPFAVTEEQVFVLLPVHQARHLPLFEEAIPVSSSLHSFLRGPPARC